MLTQLSESRFESRNPGEQALVFSGRRRMVPEVRWEGAAVICVAQLVEALSYKPEGRGLDSQSGRWDVILLSALRL